MSTTWLGITLTKLRHLFRVDKFTCFLNVRLQYCRRIFSIYEGGVELGRNRNVRKSNVEKLMQKHSDHKAVCDRKRADMTMAVNVYVVFANSQPSAADGLKDVL